MRVGCGQPPQQLLASDKALLYSLINRIKVRCRLQH
jgi:hypothetical protein